MTDKTVPIQIDPERIFPAPQCEDLYEGRTWSTERHDCDEPEFGLKAVEYIRPIWLRAPSSTQTADLLMSARRPTAAEKRTWPEVAEGPASVLRQSRRARSAQSIRGAPRRHVQMEGLSCQGP